MTDSRLHYLIWVSWRYHSYRSGLFERIVVVWVIIGMAAALVGSLMANYGYIMSVSLLCLSTLLAITLPALSRRGSMHKSLCDHFGALFYRLKQHSLEAIWTEKAALDAQSPVALNSVLAQCHNEYCARFKLSPALKIGRLDRLIGWFWQMPPSRPDWT